jgi:hypothetical protein
MQKLINITGNILLTLALGSMVYLFLFASNGQYIARIVTR